ncbi:phospho-N-acetylmuramoyl-pentapeptide-transferase [Candidatus Peregrinibacteria bacterium CG08_land_8_20_14_0_20_41_10]|nr:MAG: phospho-N-acetylmuramoyl-pentapeptide-transferase [Candidatus Peregrinibacteria bacterium CG1_02_41_10]PIS32088.1 MAG: phospho-N-acetylmuramoyl-pentapeptide-transferase [Candidatus Peregrinibacteria bacterium CG08_land_8_20_14_0_20_41_10]
MQEVPNIVFVFSYATLAFLIAFLLSPVFIKLLIRFKFASSLRENALAGGVATIFRSLHGKKAGTPLGGGILIWGTTLLVIVFSRVFSLLGLMDRSLLQRKETYLPIFTLLVASALGFFDDWLNVTKKNRKDGGIKAQPKAWWLVLFGLLGAWWFYSKLGWDVIHIPRVGDFSIGFWYIPLFVLVIVSCANAVNITDGLDGLAGGLLVIAFGAFGVISYAQGMFFLAAFCGVVIGALVAFLWFNVNPAQVFMGDTGSLGLGATLGVIAMLTNSVIVLPLIGFVFVVETLSSLIQLIARRGFGKRVFKIAPLHHHFEASGWPEQLVTMRFWIVGGVVAVIGLIVGLIGTGK